MIRIDRPIPQNPGKNCSLDSSRACSAGNCPYSVEEFERRKPVNILGLPVYLAAPEDVILSKLEWAKMGQSERQYADALGVAIVQAERLDWKYMKKWAATLDLDELCQRLLDESAEYR